MIKMIVILMLAISLTACGNGEIINIKNSDASIENEQEVNKEAPHTKVITTTYEDVKAVYIEQNDNKSVEVIVDEKPNTFLLEELKDTDFKTFTKDDKVKITYIIKNEQVKDGEIKTSYLTKIEKVNK
jgi:predicted small lipoprotein YifL